MLGTVLGYGECMNSVLNMGLIRLIDKLEKLIDLWIEKLEKEKEQ